MTISHIPIESQASLGGSLITSTGWLYAGDRSSAGEMVAASAIRFAWPEGASIIHSASLGISAAAHIGMFGSSCRLKLGVLAATSQVLPVTGTAIQTAPTTTAVRTMGWGATVDYETLLSRERFNVDLTAALLEAQSAGWLVSGDYVVITMQRTYADEDAYVSAHGIGDGSPPILTLDYGEFSPPPNDTNPFSRRLLADHTLTPAGLHPPRNLLL